MSAMTPLLLTSTFYADDSLNAAVIDEFQQRAEQWLNSSLAGLLIIDMSRVNFLDSAALVVIVNLHKQAQKKNARLILENISAELKIIFELTQLDKVLNLNNSSEYLLTSNVGHLSAA